MGAERRGIQEGAIGESKLTEPPRTHKNHVHTTIAIAIGACALTIATLFAPYLTNGMWFDDALNSQIWAMVNRFDSTLWSFTKRVTDLWLSQYGRIVLSWPIVYGFFYWIREPWLVRLVDMALVLVHIGTVAYLLRLMNLRTRTIGLFVLILVSLFQIRGTHDPIASYAAFCQVQGITLTVALILLVRWTLTARTSLLVASSLVAGLSFTAYELNLVYVPIALTVCFAKPRSTMRHAAIVLVPVAAYLAAALYVKLTAQTFYAGSSVGSIWTLPVTFLKQLVGTLPGSFYWLAQRSTYSPSQLMHDIVASKWALVLLAAAFAAMFVLIRTDEDAPRSWPRGAVLGAAAFVLLPPVLISMSAKYQAELIWGTAYLPVYYQYFGLAALAAMGLHYLPERLRVLQVAIAALFAIYVAANWTVNVRQSSLLDLQFDEPRRSLVAAMNAGLLDPVQDGDVVRIENQPMYINGNLIFQSLRKRIVIPDETAIPDWFEPHAREDATYFRLFRDAGAWQLVPETGTRSGPE